MAPSTTPAPDGAGRPAESRPGASGRISRSSDHFYTYLGERFPGTTTIIGATLDKSGPLMSWAARQTAEAAVELGDLRPMIEATGADGVVKMLSSRSSWKRDEAGNLGTEVHRLADLLVTGQELPTMTDTVRMRVRHYAAWWQSVGWTLRLSEAMVVHPVDGYGGTLDLLCRDASGKSVLADIKTGKSAGYPAETLQLTAYSGATIIQSAEGRTFTMPAVDRHVLIHVTADGVKEIEVEVGLRERIAWGNAIEIYNWLQTLKGKRG